MSEKYEVEMELNTLPIKIQKLIRYYTTSWFTFKDGRKVPYKIDLWADIDSKGNIKLTLYRKAVKDFMKSKEVTKLIKEVITHKEYCPRCLDNKCECHCKYCKPKFYRRRKS